MRHKYAAGARKPESVPLTGHNGLNMCLLSVSATAISLLLAAHPPRLNPQAQQQLAPFAAKVGQSSSDRGNINIGKLLRNVFDTP